MTTESSDIGAGAQRGAVRSKGHDVKRIAFIIVALAAAWLIGGVLAVAIPRFSPRRR